MGEEPAAGELSERPLPGLLLSLCRQRYDGALELECDGVRKRVLWRAGVPVFAHSSLPAEGLAARLHRDGRLDEASRVRVEASARERGVEEMAVLLEEGVLPAAELLRTLRDQVRRRILGCFAWSAGRYALEPGASPAAGSEALRVDPVDLVFEGLLRHWDPERLLAALAPRMERYPRPARGLAGLRERLAARPEARALLDALDGTRTLGAALEAAWSPGALAAALLADAAAVVEWAAEPLEPEKPEAPGETPEAGTAEVELVFRGGAPAPEAAPAAQPGAPADAPRSGTAEGDERLQALRAEIRERHARLEQADLYEVLGVARDADAAAVKRAYLGAAKRFHPDALASQGLGDVREQATALFAAISRAHATLRDPDSRRAYDAELAGEGPVDTDRLANAEALFRKGEVMLRAGDFAGALPFLRPAVEFWPEEPAYHSALGWALFRKNPPDPDAARRHLTKAVQLGKDDAKAHLRLSLLLKGLGETDAAERHAARAKKLDPKVTPR